jgi:hypothetical protein
MTHLPAGASRGQQKPAGASSMKSKIALVFEAGSDGVNILLMRSYEQFVSFCQLPLRDQEPSLLLDQHAAKSCQSSRVLKPSCLI